MIQHLKIDDQAVDLDVDPGGEDRFTAHIGEHCHSVVYRRIAGNWIHLSVDGRQTAAFVADTPEGKVVMIKGRMWRVEDAAGRPVRRRSIGTDSPRQVTPLMPAVVSGILVKAGESVQKGQGVIVVSAMKMDTTLTAPFDGVVTRINVAEGEKVAPGQVLVDIEAVEAGEG